MGILGFFSGGGNFGWIARNVAAIYYSVINSSSGKDLTAGQQLYSAAFIDLLNYFKEGSIRHEELEKEMQKNNKGLICYNTRNASSPSYSLLTDILNDETYDIFPLVHLIMVVEKMIFKIDSRISEEGIVESILDKRNVIVNEVKTIMNQGFQSKLVQRWFPIVEGVLSTPPYSSTFQNIDIEFF